MMHKRNLAAEILAGLDDFQAWRDGKRSLRVHKVVLPRAADVSRIRSKLNLSQEAFAAFIGVPVGTVRNWEQKRREPQGPARAFLHVASNEPQAVLAAFSAKAAPRPAKQMASHSRSLAAAINHPRKRASTSRSRAA